MRRGHRRAAVAAMVVMAAVGALAPDWASAGGETHRAAVVVDTGDEVKTARITFEGDSVSGVEALRLAGFDPVVRSYGGQGGAVCSVCGRGCAADSTCLTCGGANYWAYFRAVGGAGSYSYSPVGAGTTRVHDGDVEAWKWGPGVPPSFASFSEVWGETATTVAPSPPSSSPPTSRPPTATTQAGAGGPVTTAADTGAPASTSLPGDGVPASTAGSGAPGGDAPGATGAPVSGAAGGGAAGETAAAGDGREEGGGPGSGAPTTAAVRSQGRVSTTTANKGERAREFGQDATAAPGDGGPAGDVAVAPVAPAVDTGGSGSAAGLAVFGTVVLGLGAWIARARVTRRRTAAT